MSDADKQRRAQDPMDYDRAQPSLEDHDRVVAFLDDELGIHNARHTQAHRKLCLVLARQFNAGWDAAVAELSAQLGFNEGWNACLKQMELVIRQMKREGSK